VTDEQAATFTMLLARACVEEPETSDPAVKLLWVWLHKPEGRALLERDDFMRSAWEIVAVRSRMNAREDMPWSRVLGAMGQQDPGRAAAVAACGLASESLHMARYAEELLVELVELDPEAVMVAVGGVLFEDSEYLAHRRLKRLFAAIPDDVLVAWIERHGVEAARRSARHLPAPYLRGGEPVVPRVTAFVLERFEDDEHVFAKFIAGVHGSQLCSGDIAGEHDHEVEVARAFADHPLRRVREWAGHEEQSASRAAERWRQRDAERSIAHG
jgi:hypothetical protein